MGATAGSVNVEIGATFAGTFHAAFGGAEKQVGKLGATVRELDGKLQRVQGFQRQRQAAIDAEGAWRKADEELRSMGQHLAGLGTVTDKQAREFKALEKRTEAARAAMVKARGDADRMERELREAGQSTSSLAEQQRTLERQLQATTNRMKALAGLANSGVGPALGQVGSQFRSLATQATIAGAGLGYFFKKNFMDVASEFEKFKTILETTEGSSAGAQKAMDWVSEFAAKTPFELAEVTEAFVKLRSYGLDPTTGLLKTLGDTGAAMGKPVMQAVEAIADAVTGENERLKEFGIKGSKKGGKVTYEYTDKAGQQRTKTVDAENRKMIESTLTAIWNEKYGGAMDKLAGTWAGMVSSVGDQWTRFANMVMDSGPFELMKNRLGELLATIDRMAEDGTLKQYAEQTGRALTQFAEGAWEVGKAVVATTRWLADFVGGWKNLAIVLLGLKLAPLIWSIGKLGWALGGAANLLLMFATGTASAGAAWVAFGGAFVKWACLALTAFRALAVFMLTNPIGIALAALTAAGYLAWQNWDKIKGWLIAIWQGVTSAGVAAFEWMKEKITAIFDWFDGKFGTFLKKIAEASSVIGHLTMGEFGTAWSTAKSVVGFGDGKPTAVDQALTTLRGPVAPVPAQRGGANYTDSSTFNAPITINGATDPQETAKAVRAELEKRERERAAARRGMMTDALGY